MTQEKSLAHELINRPEPDAAHKPHSPKDLPARSWKFTLQQTLKQFSNDQCTDLAAALTYYAVLALFPAAITLVSILGIFAQGPETFESLLSIADEVGGEDIAGTVREPLMSLSSTSGLGLAVFVGLAGALWSASGYVGAFGRALNRMYGVPEGRKFLKLRLQTLALTTVLLLMTAMVAIALVLTGSLAGAIGEQLGFGETGLTVWTGAKWPVLIAFVTLIVTLLYRYPSNVRQPSWRWVSPGALFAIVLWILGSIAFGLYVGNFGSYDKTYGSLAGVAVFLLWVWLTNLALLMGAELDAQLERVRELQAGMDAEADPLLPVNDTDKIEKQEEKHEEELAQARRLKPEEA